MGTPAGRSTMTGDRHADAETRMAILLAVLGLNLLGDAVTDVLTGQR